MANRAPAGCGERNSGTLDFKTVGLRWVGKAEPIDYRTEMAAQVGTLGQDRVRAWAGHWTAGYTLPVMKWVPRFSIEYNYATGDKNPHDSVRGAFDVLYPSPHDQYGLCDQVGWRNIHDLRLGWDFKPAVKVSWSRITTIGGWQAPEVRFTRRSDCRL